jgi:hypothetical protein
MNLASVLRICALMAMVSAWVPKSASLSNPFRRFATLSPGHDEVTQHIQAMPTWTKSMGLVTAGIIAAGVLLDGHAPEEYANHYTPHKQRLIPVAHADSTGKMSTKLTARKRYLPRIKDGVEKFNLITTDKAVADAFLKGSADGSKTKPGSENFIRAMSLFGASLRVGETPDKVSREADTIVASFSKELQKVAAQSKITKESVAPARELLREYIAFAEKHVASPIDHYEVQ